MKKQIVRFAFLLFLIVLLSLQAFAAQEAEPNDALKTATPIALEKEIRAVLAGHLHKNAESPLPSGIMQYVTGGGFADLAREIEFI